LPVPLNVMMPAVVVAVLSAVFGDLHFRATVDRYVKPTTVGLLHIRPQQRLNPFIVEPAHRARPNVLHACRRREDGGTFSGLAASNRSDAINVFTAEAGGPDLVALTHPSSLFHSPAYGYPLLFRATQAQCGNEGQSRSPEDQASTSPVS
jgi:hypothetical protein